VPGGPAFAGLKGLKRIKGRLPVASKRISRPWYKKWWIWTLAGLAIGGGITAAVMVKLRRYETDVVLRK